MQKWITAVFVVFISTGIVLAQGNGAQGKSYFWFQGGGGLMAGHTTYQIGGTVTDPFGSDTTYFPFSELAFPLDVAIVKIKGGARINERVKVGFSGLGNVTDDPGEMEDSDWITSSDPNRLDIFSTSDSELEAFVVDLDLIFDLIHSDDFCLGVGAGLMVQNFSYECRLNRQWSPSGLVGYDYDGDGTVGITYEVMYIIPYVAAEGVLSLGGLLNLSGSVGIAPWIRATDEDVHLLRVPAITAEGEYDGFALLFSVEGRLNLGDTLFLGAELTALLIEAEGEQENSELGRWTWTTDAELESAQVTATATLGFGF